MQKEEKVVDGPRGLWEVVGGMKEEKGKRREEKGGGGERD